MKRYQDCNLVIRLYRRLKYQPYYFIYALILSGFHVNSLIFKLIYVSWQSKAEWWLTTEEVHERLGKLYEQD